MWAFLISKVLVTRSYLPCLPSRASFLSLFCFPFYVLHVVSDLEDDVNSFNNARLNGGKKRKKKRRHRYVLIVYSHCLCFTFTVIVFSHCLQLWVMFTVIGNLYSNCNVYRNCLQLLFYKGII